MTKPANDFDEYSKRVRYDHYAHKFFTLSVAAYGWQLHGWLIGFGVLISLVFVVLITNTGIMAIAGEQNMFRFIRINRWAWLICAAVALALSGATTSSI